MPDLDELAAARLRFPTGERVRGRIVAKPWGDGITGLFVDLGARPTGFVDVLNLPEEPRPWPEIGQEGLFEVLQHRPGQVRLYPLDASMRTRRNTRFRLSGPDWAAVSARYPVGSTVTATVTHVFPSNREYVVEFDSHHAVLEYEDPAPTVGTVGRYHVVRLLEWTQRIQAVKA
ncbi:hypothetical protein [Actinocatenispora rupis]|uniref:S1 RNA binding domain-containing protein n=1 Tax=Actinocatenispora rupis TaxID=519421 RepID=A0A8J3J700_9ACTN|nr:hypothetical protein [Actinocatenispora rupis]GID11229.1 hypothetical protein Aru02nite_21180 [Actinocatenispora rupis]